MAGYAPQVQIEQHLADHELESIINTLIFGSKNALDELDNMTKNLDALCSRVSGRLMNYTSTHGQYVSKWEVDRVLKGMLPALEHVQFAQGEIIELLEIAELKMKQSLLAPSPFLQTDQLVISAGRESLLWRRVACRRVDVTPPTGNASLKDRALLAASYISHASECWNTATNHLKEDMMAAVEHLKEPLEILAQVRHRTGHVTNSAVAEVHHILASLRDVVVAIKDTLPGNFKQTRKDIEGIRNSLLEECDSWLALYD